MKENKQSKTPDITFGKALLCIIGLIIVLALGFAIIGFDTKVTFLMASIVVGIFLVAYGYKLDQDVYKRQGLHERYHAAQAYGADI